MVEDAVKSLLRGCKGDSLKIWKSTNKRPKPSSIPESKHVKSLPQLDFFRTNTVSSLHNTPTQQNATQKEKESINEVNNIEQETTKESMLDHKLRDLIPHPKLQNALEGMGIVSAKPIQRRAIPLIREGHDVIGIAPTGSGKTLAYVLPLAEYILSNERITKPCAPAILIVSPTRELAEQIGRVISRLKHNGGSRIRSITLINRASIAGLQSGEGGAIDMMVGTPLRITAAIQNGSLNMGDVKHVVLDEADELLDTKFVAQIDTILEACGKRIGGSRIHLFSATLPTRVEELAGGLLSHAKKVVVGGGAWGGSAAVTDIAKTIEQRFMFVGGRGEQGKVLAVRELIRGGIRAPVLVFVQTKERAAELFRELVYDGIRVEAVHADRSASARSSAVARFRKGEVWVLIATDVLARGLDLLGVNSVISYDVPSSATAYVHRIGRTGRNGRSGVAVTLFTEEDKKVVGPVVKIANASGAQVPEWLMKLASKVRADEARRLETRPPKRRHVGGIRKRRWKQGRKQTKKEKEKSNTVEHEDDE